MEQLGYISSPANLDAIFAALSDSTRRDILCKLKDGPESVSDISARYEMSQPAISKHLKVLEKAGLVDRAIDKQRRPVTLNARNLTTAIRWIQDFQTFWNGSFDQLDTVLQTFNSNNK